MKLLLAFLTSVLALPAAQSQSGFANGNDIDITVYRGRIHVRCMNTGWTDTHYCTGEDIQPGARDSFVFNQRVNANRVELKALHEDGSERSKKKKFDSNKGISKKFNLLLSSLFQRPLLELGTNRVQYELSDGNKTVASGEFESHVEILDELRCPDMWISEYGNQCNNAAAACSTYFNRITGCQ